MDTSVIAAITGLLQVAGTIIVIKIQQNQIAGLRLSIKDQKDSIDALKTQAEGQVSLTKQQENVTEQLRKLISDISAGYDKKISLIETNEQKEKQVIQDELRRTQERLTAQLEGVNQLEIPAELASTLSQILEDNFSAKSEVAGLRTDMASLTATIQASLPTERPLSIAVPTEEFHSQLADSLKQAIKSNDLLVNFERETMLQIFHQVHGLHYGKSIREILQRIILREFMDILATKYLEAGLFPGRDYNFIRQYVGAREPFYYSIAKLASDKIITS